MKGFLIKRYLSLIRFSHTVFALPFAIIGFVLPYRHDEYLFSLHTLVLVILCMVFARSSAMAFNRFTDWRFDKDNPRTSSREIPAGIITPAAALVFSIVTAVLFSAATYFINSICFYLSPVALAVILPYSYTKRFTAWCHMILGLGLSLAPIGAYLAVTARFDILPVFFSIIVLFWVSGFDIIYALPDEAFDKQWNLHSVPGRFGKKTALRISTGFHVLTALFTGIAGWYGSFGILYWSGALFFIALLVYQHRIVTPDNLSRINLAFAATNGAASVLFAIFVCMDILLPVIPA